jgi:hypothetical protein
MMRGITVLLPVLLVVLVVIGGLAQAATVSSLKITVNLDGKPLANAVVELWHNGSLVVRGTTDTNGTVSFANVTTQVYTVYVYNGGKVYTTTINVTNTTTSLTLNFTSTPTTTNTSTTTNLTNTTIVDWDWLNRNKVMVVSGVAVFLLLILLIAYAYSGKRIPHRR